jgi:hypothetical protein
VLWAWSSKQETLAKGLFILELVLDGKPQGKRAVCSLGIRAWVSGVPELEDVELGTIAEAQQALLSALGLSA